MKKYLIGMFACAALFACTSDEVDEQTSVFGDQDQAYVQIRLRNASPSTRGTEGNPAFSEGETDENAVNRAEFYFYDADGSYNQHVSKPLSWNASTGNVEKIADATIVLTGLKDKTAPKYVVAVLNAPVDAYKDLDLDDIEAAIVADYKNGAYFIMTNSTYQGTATQVDQDNYFATVLTEDNFLSEKPNFDQLTKDNDVDIYVERLAVKVHVKSSVANTDGEITIGKYQIDGAASADLKIKLLGWGLNATNKESYLEKRVPAWTTTYGDFTWSAPNYYRSYWAKSPNYGAGKTYPISYGQADDGTAVLKDNAGNAALNYISWNDLKNTFDEETTGYAYCMENTNNEDELTTGNFHAKVTHVLLQAQTVAGKDLIRYDGQLFTLDGFKARVLNLMNIKEAYKGSVDGEAIDVNDLKIENTYDGDVNVVLADNSTWVDGNGQAVDVAATLASLKIDAEYYKDGKMYYNIPIEHLRNEGGMSVDSNGKITVKEAEYGVVRNHYYVLDIKKIENLGVSVWDPAEPIVPNMETPSFYVGASVNILSWHVVNQNVEL